MTLTFNSKVIIGTPLAIIELNMNSLHQKLKAKFVQIYLKTSKLSLRLARKILTFLSIFDIDRKIKGISLFRDISCLRGSGEQIIV